METRYHGVCNILLWNVARAESDLFSPRRVPKKNVQTPWRRDVHRHQHRSEPDVGVFIVREVPKRKRHQTTAIYLLANPNVGFVTMATTKPAMKWRHGTGVCNILLWNVARAESDLFSPRRIPKKNVPNAVAPCRSSTPT